MATSDMQQLATENNVFFSFCEFIADVDEKRMSDDVVIRVALAFQVRLFFCIRALVPNVSVVVARKTRSGTRWI